MKPTIEILEGRGWDIDNGRTTDLEQVALVPSHEKGCFVAEDPHYGKVVVNKLVLRQVSEDDLKSLKATGEFPLDDYIDDRADGSYIVNHEHAEINIPLNRGSGNSTTRHIGRFSEFAPVVAEVVITS